MLKVAVLNDSKQSIGGGWSFIRNLKKGLEGKALVVDSLQDNADIILFPSSSMIGKETAQAVRDSGKPLVLRVDNVPRNSRNRNTGTSRLRAYADMAKAVVYQSEWARDYLSPFIGFSHGGQVIYNGVDTTVFMPGERENKPIFLYSRYNRDETKSWERAWYQFQMISRLNKEAKLYLVGNFSPEQIEYNFDFFMGEDVTYLGIIEEPTRMAKVYRMCRYFLATYFNDAYSNTYQEALACGVELYNPDMSGGTPELIKNGPRSLEQMANDYLRLFEQVVQK